MVGAMPDPIPSRAAGAAIEAYRFIRAVFDNQQGAQFSLSEDTVSALAHAAIGNMRAIAVMNGCSTEDEILAYVSGLIDNQITAFMAGNDDDLP
jgi:hypothetical protein